MAFAGLIFIGLLFGIVLGAGAVGFIVVRAGGPMKESLFGDGPVGPLFGRQLVKPAPAQATDADNRLRASLEEQRILQKLVDQSRVERELQDTAAKAAAAELTALREQLADRNVRIQSLEASLREATLRVDNTVARLNERSEELATVSLQLKDARIELEVAESGAALASAQVMELQRERDELAARVTLKPAPPVYGQRRA